MYTPLLPAHSSSAQLSSAGNQAPILDRLQYSPHSSLFRAQTSTPVNFAVGIDEFQCVTSPYPPHALQIGLSLQKLSSVQTQLETEPHQCFGLAHLPCWPLFERSQLGCSGLLLVQAGLQGECWLVMQGQT